MLKKEIRKYYKNIRNAFSEEQVLANSLAITNHVKEFGVEKFQYFHIFLPIKKNNEIDTYPLIDWLFDKNKKIVVPKVINKDTISCLVKPNFEVSLSKWDIPEPIDYQEINSNLLDVVFVPMFVADKKGNRVGYGGGFYDKLLARCKPETLKIGLSFFNPIDNITDIYSGDISLDYCITPSKIIYF